MRPATNRDIRSLMTFSNQLSNNSHLQLHTTNILSKVKKNLKKCLCDAKDLIAFTFTFAVIHMQYDPHYSEYDLRI